MYDGCNLWLVERICYKFLVGERYCLYEVYFDFRKESYEQPQNIYNVCAYER